MRSQRLLALFAVPAAFAISGCMFLFAREGTSPQDVLPEYHNREVTALVEDSESVRLALGAAWDDARRPRRGSERASG